MARRFSLLAILIAVGLAQLASAPQTQSPREFDRSRRFVPAELLVGFRPGAGPPDIAAVYQLHGLEERESLDPRGGTALRRVVFPLTPGESLEEQTQRIITRLMR